MINKFEVLKKYGEGVFTLEEAAKLLGTSDKVVKMQHTLWKPKLEKIIPVIQALSEQPENKGQQARLKERLAKAMGTTKRNTNRQLKAAKIEVPVPKKTQKRKDLHRNAAEKWEIRQKYAFDVILGLDTPENAGVGAEVSSRQMYRWVNKMLGLIGITLRDLKDETWHNARKC